MAAMHWRVVVADESHMMRTHNKAPDAAFTEAAAAIGRRADRLLLLSGTPSLNRPFDLFRQVMDWSLSAEVHLGPNKAAICAACSAL